MNYGNKDECVIANNEIPITEEILAICKQCYYFKEGECPGGTKTDSCYATI